MNKQEVAALLLARKGERNWHVFAREVGVSPSYLRDIANGNRTPGPKVLKYLNLERVYQRKKG